MLEHLRNVFGCRASSTYLSQPNHIIFRSILKFSMIIVFAILYRAVFVYTVSHSFYEVNGGWGKSHDSSSVLGPHPIHGARESCRETREPSQVRSNGTTYITRSPLFDLTGSHLRYPAS